MDITLKFSFRGSTQHYYIGNVYAPSDDKDIDYPGCLDKFYCDLDTHLATIPNTHQIILGGDFNARIGTRQVPEDQPVLGPYGLTQHNDCGERVLNLARSNELRVAGT